MKKILIVLFLAASNHVSSQPTTTSTGLTKVDIFEKSIKQKRAGWSLLGSGSGLALLGMITFPRDYSIIGGNSSATEANATLSSLLLLSGAACLITSIPFFISSSANRKRSNQMTSFHFKTEKVLLPTDLKLVNPNYPAFSIRLIIR